MRKNKIEPSLGKVYAFPILMFCLICVVATLVIWSRFDLSPLVSYIIAASIGAFVLCGYDKSQAGVGNNRVPEFILLGSAFLGGSAGLLIGMRLFRHKTRKKSFHIILFLIIVVQILLVRLLFGDALIGRIER